MPAELDHLVLATVDLAAGTDELERLTGLRPVPGGAHPGLGTRNVLLGLRWRGETRCYLELLGPDPEQPDVPRDAMMLDLGARLAAWPGGPVRTHTWVVRPEGSARTELVLDAALDRAREAGLDVGSPVATSRRTPDGALLSWRLAAPRPLGMRGLQPALIEWGSAAHPSDADLPTVELTELVLEHPDPGEAQARLQLLGAGHPVVGGPLPRMTVVLDTPGGRVVIG
jgi:hypothetical protein